MDEMNMRTNENLNPQTNMPAMGKDMKIDDKTIKKIAGEAIGQVDGVLGFRRRPNRHAEKQ